MLFGPCSLKGTVLATGHTTVNKIVPLKAYSLLGKRDCGETGKQVKTVLHLHKSSLSNTFCESVLDINQSCLELWTHSADVHTAALETSKHARSCLLSLLPFFLGKLYHYCVEVKKKKVDIVEVKKLKAILNTSDQVLALS